MAARRWPCLYKSLVHWHHSPSLRATGRRSNTPASWRDPLAEAKQRKQRTDGSMTRARKLGCRAIGGLARSARHCRMVPNHTVDFRRTQHTPHYLSQNFHLW